MESPMGAMIRILVLLACTAIGECLKPQQRPEPPACPPGYFFCTFHNLDCCSKQNEYCSSFSKACELVKFEKPLIDECCQFLGNWSKHDIRYEVGTEEEGRLQVCLYNLGLISWNATCTERDAAPTPTETTPKHESGGSVHADSVAETVNCHGTLLIVIGIGIIILGILLAAQLVFTIAVHWDIVKSWRQQNSSPRRPADLKTPNLYSGSSIEEDPKDLKKPRVRNRKPPSPGGVSIGSDDEEKMNFAKKRES